MADTLRNTEQYTQIMNRLSWLDRNVRLDPQEFADDFLQKLADELGEVVEAVSEGRI